MVLMATVSILTHSLSIRLPYASADDQEAARVLCSYLGYRTAQLLNIAPTDTDLTPFCPTLTLDTNTEPPSLVSDFQPSNGYGRVMRVAPLMRPVTRTQPPCLYSTHLAPSALLASLSSYHS